MYQKKILTGFNLIVSFLYWWQPNTDVGNTADRGNGESRGGGVVRRIPGLTLSQSTQLQIPVKRPRGRLEGCGTWRGPWGSGAARAGAWTEDETLTAGSSLATKQPQRDNHSQQKQYE